MRPRMHPSGEDYQRQVEAAGFHYYWGLPITGAARF